MWFARIGGAFLIGGGVLAVGAILSAPKVSGSPDLGGMISGTGGQMLLFAALSLIALGAASLGISDAAAFDRRDVRSGLWTLAIGLAVLTFVLLLLQPGGVRGPETDLLIVPLASSGLVTVVGALVTGLALARGKAPSKGVASVLLTGLTLLVFGNWTRHGNPPQPGALAMSAVGGIVLAIGFVALGGLGVAVRPEPAPKAT